MNGSPAYEQGATPLATKGIDAVKNGVENPIIWNNR